ncbi:MAG: protein kinase, partial [Deltaproteobacteria bacterium]|nr:protein kinase [Deltaproteobacteria bacterium]
RLLAIKRILPTMVEDTEFITMFLDEARISVQLNHANVVQIYELGKHDDSYYIAMEYVSGKDLRHLLEYYRKHQSVMPTAQAVYIASKICEGLEYAHRKKDARGVELHIVHRDVSPQNILLSYDSEVKLIDFGIAKAANRAQKTQAGILKGKFGYMSPEQVRGLPVDHRSDVFAVGVILYEMLTGERLFVGESDFSTLEKVRNADVLPPRQFNSEIPPGLEKVVLKALARDVEDRYQWCSDIQEDLMRYLLSGDTIYSPKHLAAFMREAFGDDLSREQARLEHYASVARPAVVEVSGITASSALMPAARARPAPQRQPEAEPEFEPELELELEPEPESPAPSPRRRPTHNPPKPLQPAEPFEVDKNATLMGLDPYNPVIPPPMPGELDDPPADRTEIFRPNFELPKPTARKSSRGVLVPEEGAQSSMGSGVGSRFSKEIPKGTVSMRGGESLVPEEESLGELDPADEPSKEGGADSVVPTVIGNAASPRANGHQRPSRRSAPVESEDFESAGELLPDGPATAPPGTMEPITGVTGLDGDEQGEHEQAPAHDTNADLLRPLAAAARRSEREVPRQTPAKQPAGRISNPKQPVARQQDPTTSRPPHPVVAGAKHKKAKRIPTLALVVVIAGALAMVLIVALTIFLRPPAKGSAMVAIKGPVEGKVRVIIDEKHAVKLGETIALPSGSHVVVVEAQGHKPIQKEFSVRPDMRTKVEVTLPDAEDAVAPEPKPDSPRPEPKPEDAHPAAADAKKPEDKVPADGKPHEDPGAADPNKPGEKKPADTKAAEVKKVRSLKVESTPTDADIEINGKRRGKTGAVIKDLIPGEVKFVTVSLKGYKKQTRAVEWKEEGAEDAIFFALEREAPQKPASDKKPETVVGNDKPKPQPEKPKPPPKAMGKLVTISNPVAAVSVDGRDTGRWTPIPPAQPLEIPVGDHVITYTAGDGRKATRKVTIMANENSMIKSVTDFK